ncbi:hypothetical protein BKA70DRAFT_1393670 [Coprinopsis sp. MPI-PUGE-AT-0042]|nr:hypothetical protein BKA70DRAFT_1393670 [Coprinopsis sp. MPI-PUGE-AT-0042]
MDSLPSFPFLKLPPELQGRILEYAADISVGNASNLALVSRFAAQYVQPRIFRNVYLGSRTGPEDLECEDMSIPTSLPKGFLALHVKYLRMTAYVEGNLAAAVVSACTGIIDLLLWADLWGYLGEITVEDRQEQCSRLLHSLHLQRFSCRYDHLWNVEAFSGSSFHPWFHTLTHLKIFYAAVDDIEEHFTVPLLKQLTSLTHLCLAPEPGFGNTFSESGLLAVLDARPSLQILVAQVYLEGLLQELLEKPWVEPRIVYQLDLSGEEAIADWEAHLEGKPTMWMKAEECVRKRRSEAHGR